MTDENQVRTIAPNINIPIDVNEGVAFTLPSVPKTETKTEAPKTETNILPPQKPSAQAREPRTYVDMFSSETVVPQQSVGGGRKKRKISIQSKHENTNLLLRSFMESMQL